MQISKNIKNELHYKTIMKEGIKKITPKEQEPSLNKTLLQTSNQSNKCISYFSFNLLWTLPKLNKERIQTDRLKNEEIDDNAQDFILER